MAENGQSQLGLEKGDPNRTVGRSYDMRYHGTAELRGGNCPHSRYYDSGRFGRLFPTLPKFIPDPVALEKLGAKGGPMDGTGQDPNANPDHPDGLPAGFTFLGQFVDHDITFDPTSSLERQSDPEAVSNFRTPVLELDNVYGAGPGASPHLYTKADRDFLLVGKDTGLGDNDVPRNPEGTALLGDPRNDENLIISQLQVAFIKFHNAVVRQVKTSPPASGSIFEEAQRIVRWHYQWILVNEFIPHIVGQKLVDSILKDGPKFYKPRHEPYIPVEFAVAAYRFGHSQIRPGYAISADFGAPLFVAPPQPVPDDQPPADLSGGRKIVPAQTIDWKRFFALGAEAPQPGKRFDTKISPPLMNLPAFSNKPGDPSSLAQRNLMRGVTFGLPSGQSVANAMGEKVLTPDELGTAAKDLGFGSQTPLWFYILKEADVLAGGKTLGPVGGRIVGEVLLGLLTGDRFSYLRAGKNWKPTLGTGQKFAMSDLLKFAGVA